jgi:hypothetical protein
MRKKVLALSLSLLFFGSVATSTFAGTVNMTNDIVNVDDDKDKDKKKSKSTAKATTEKSGDCSTAKKTECCQKTCDDKKSATAKK